MITLSKIKFQCCYILEKFLIFGALYHESSVNRYFHFQNKSYIHNVRRTSFSLYSWWKLFNSFFGLWHFLNVAVIIASGSVNPEVILAHTLKYTRTPLKLQNSQQRSTSSKEVPFRCDLCFKKFWSHHILRNHVKNIHWKDSLKKNK